MRSLHLFAGAGGGLLADLLLGHRPTVAVEIEPYCRQILEARRRKGWFPHLEEIHDDVTTFQGSRWQGHIDILCGGFPCQDISVAGKGRGLSGERSGLFFELIRVVREVRPRYVFLENSPAITVRGLDRLLAELAALGFDAEWLCLPASAVGAPHRRDRWWLLARMADADSTGLAQRQGQEAQRAHAAADGADRGRRGADDAPEPRLGGAPDGLARWLDRSAAYWAGDWEHGVPRVTDRREHRVSRLTALGNGQVPQCAAVAFLTLMQRLERP